MDSPWVVFDLGETLIDETSNWARHAEHLGVSTLTFFGVLGAVIAERRPHTDVFDYFPERPVRHEWRLNANDLYDDALPTLAAVRDLGARLAVMANQPLEAAPFLATLPVDAVATSADWGVAKPDPAFFRRVCAELDAPPERIAYVGDRVDNDVVPAKAARLPQRRSRMLINVCRSGHRTRPVSGSTDTVRQVGVRNRRWRRSCRSRPG